MKMLVSSEPNSGSSSCAQSILNSPTLARVERARIRNETGRMSRDESLVKKILDPKFTYLTGKLPIDSISGPIKRGLLWQQRDRLFSRWKERYFVLTRDYLHCFKRASGSASERISDMGQFIFKVKLVDVEKVEWLNRRSYSVISLYLGNREGRVLLRCENCLEDWFELLEECTSSSKERRRALRNVQGPRSRASLAAPPSHSSLQTNHMGLGGTYSSALEDWLLTARHKTVSSNSAIHFPLSDSVPDLTGCGSNNEFNGLSTNHSTPQKNSYHVNHHLNHNQLYLRHNHYLQQQANNNNNNNNSRYSINSNSGGGGGGSIVDGAYPSGGHNNSGNSYSNGMCGTPTTRVNIKNYLDEDNNERSNVNNGERQNGNNDDDDADDDGDDDNDNEVELRRPTVGNKRYENGNDRNRDSSDWMYQKPIGPNDIRHSSYDSSLDTPPSTHRPSSYRDVIYSAKDSPSRSTFITAAGNTRINSNDFRYSVQEKLLCARNENEKHYLHRPNNNEMYDPNQNRYYKINEIINNGNNMNESAFIRGEKYHQQQQQQQQSHQQQHQQQHPVLMAIIKDTTHGSKFRDRAFSDIQQLPRRPFHNNSPSPRRRPLFGTPTRV